MTTQLRRTLVALALVPAGCGDAGGDPMMEEATGTETATADTIGATGSTTDAMDTTSGGSSGSDGADGSTSGSDSTDDGGSTDDDGSSTGEPVDLPPGPPELLISREGQPVDLELDATSVYWTEAGSGSGLHEIPLAGGVATELADDARGAGIVRDGDVLYWASWGPAFGTGTVHVHPLDGDAPWALATDEDNPGGLAFDADYLYWSSGGPSVETGFVRRTLRDGTGIPEVVVSGQPVINAVARTTDSVLWLSRDNVGQTPDVGPEQLLAPVTGLAWGLEADGDEVFFTDTDVGITTLSLAGGPSVVLVPVDDVYSLTTDDEHVYFSRAAEVWRVPRDGGDAEMISAHVPGQRAGFLVTDETHVYWTVRTPDGPGEIWRAAKADEGA